MIASLPMYDLPAIRARTDAWWHGLARHMHAAGIDGVPADLSRDAGPHWLHEDLLFSQTCGYPFTHDLAGRVQLIATPAYAAPGCSGSRYSSAIVVAEHAAGDTLADFRDTVCAYNESASHSGFNVLRYMVAPLAGNGPFFRDTVRTGGHRESIATVGAGNADLCTVDAVSHALLARHEPELLVGTRVLMYSPQAPGLPYVSGRGVQIDTRQRLREALRGALADPDLAETRDALLIQGAEELGPQDYEVILDMEREAIARGYDELR